MKRNKGESETKDCPFCYLIEGFQMHNSDAKMLGKSMTKLAT